MPVPPPTKGESGLTRATFCVQWVELAHKHTLDNKSLASVLKIIPKWALSIGELAGERLGTTLVSGFFYAI